MPTPAARALLIEPYLGYGTASHLMFGGRVLKNRRYATQSEADPGWLNLVELYKRMESDEVPGARVRARFQGHDQEAITDGEGYFSFDMQLERPPAGSEWQTIDLELVEPASTPGRAVRATAEVLVPPVSARFGVISDIDDTVLWTNVANKLKMLSMLARSNAYTRKPFKGVAAFYRALRNGAGGSEANPVFYVSSSPWNLYAPLVEFLRVQGIPGGPLLLRDFGVRTLIITHDRNPHKLASIERILETYPHLQFVLIGDSGERDPEIYSQVVKAHPHRIRVIYIRSVDPDPSRIEAIDTLIAEVRQTGAQLVLAPDSEFAAVHAAGEGLISAHDLSSVRLNKSQDDRSPLPEG